MQSDENLIFLDLETTGLKPVRTNRILEIGMLPVNGRTLEVLDAGWSITVHPNGYNFDDMHDVPRAMHTENGLLKELQDGEPVGLQEATRLAIQYAERYCIRGQSPVCGSSVRFDREYMEVWMPGVDNWFHYRIIDVSSIKESWKRWFGTEAPKPPKKNHRVLDDCRASLEEYKWYKDQITGEARSSKCLVE